MVSKKQDDRLPAGWKVQVRAKNSRKFKCYTNKKTNKKFYSKLAVLRYIKDISIGNESSRTMKGHTKKSSAKKQFHAVEVNDLHEGIPNGWVMDLRTRKTGPRKGTTYKCYIDPATGSTFFSKPQVYRYLESLQSNAGSSQQREKGSSRHSSDNKSPDPPSPLNSCVESNVSQLSETHVRKSHSLEKRKVVIETTTDNELPPGWIKEIRHKMIGEVVVRSDPFYVDPTRLVFRSKPDALRYIKTGEVSRHAYRRKNTNINGEEFAVVKTSPPASDEREKATNTTTRKQLFTDEVGHKQCVSSVPEADGIKETGSKRITRSSSRVANLDHSTPLLQPASIKETGSKRITRSSSRVANLDHSTLLLQPTSIKETGSKRITRSSSRVANLDHSTQLLQPVSIKETGSKRITRSSSRVTNLDHSTLLLQPANNAQEMSPGKSLTEKIDPTEVTEGITKVRLPKVQDDDGKKGDATHRESKPSTVPSKGLLIEEKPETVAMKSCSDERAQTSKRKAKDGKQTPNLPSRSSKRLAGVGTEVVYHSIPIEHASRATNRKPIKVQGDSSLGSTPSQSREKPQTLDFIARNGLLASQDEKFRPLNTDAQTVLATQEGPFKLCFQPEIDLLERYPPGFSQNPRIESSPIRTDQSVDPKDTFMGSKIENSPGNSQLAKEHPNELRESRIENSPRVDPIQVEQPAMAEREIEHPESQFCFPSPLWSDPCLEFAYKTLTGAIPLDDSLAIEDYIQHQIRTSSEQSNNNRGLPNMGVPSGETKPISSLPEDFGIPKSNGFGSQRTSR